jgi:dynein heavy chain
VIVVAIVVVWLWSRRSPLALVVCSVDWYQAWPHEALLSTATSMLADPSLPLSPELRLSVSHLCVDVHEDASRLAARYVSQMRRVTYITPSSFTELIIVFKRLLTEKTRAITDEGARLTSSVNKLIETSAMVAKMKEQVCCRFANLCVAVVVAAGAPSLFRLPCAAVVCDRLRRLLVQLEQLQPILRQNAVETEEVIRELDVESREVESIRTVVAKDEAIAEAKALEAHTIQMECESDLAAAIPAVEAAVAALQSIRKQDLVEVKTMASPPIHVKLVMEAVCVLFKIEPKRIKLDPSRPTEVILDFWEPSRKQLLSDPKLIQRLIDFDKDNVDPRIIETVQTNFVNNPLLNPEMIRKVRTMSAVACANYVLSSPPVPCVCAPSSSPQLLHFGLLAIAPSCRSLFHRCRRRAFVSCNHTGGCIVPRHPSPRSESRAGCELSWSTTPSSSTSRRRDSAWRRRRPSTARSRAACDRSAASWIEFSDGLWSLQTS